jgi:zinc transport system permease protein
MAMIHDFLQYSFLQNALFAGILIGIICPVVGVYLVVRRLSLIAEALSHVTLSGVAAGLWLQKEFGVALGVSPTYFGMLFALLGSLFVEQIRRFYQSFQEIAIPILLSGGIGIGVVLISAADGFNVDIAGYLFGNILAVRDEELLVIASVCFIGLLFLLLFYKEMFALSFDEENAIVTGVPRRLVNFLFTLLVALVVSSAIRVVGILLVSSLITLPVATSLQHAKSFRQALVWSVVYAQVSVIFGLILAYYWDLASGGAIVLVAIALLIGVLLGKRGIRKLRRREDLWI